MLILAIIAIFFYVLGFYRQFFLYAGLLLQVAYLFQRGIQLDRLPLVGPHDTLFFMSASIMLFAMPIAWQIKDEKRFTISITVLVILFVLLSMRYPPHNSPLPPVLTTFWFETHVAFSFFSYALFGIAAVLGILFFFKNGDVFEILQYKTILVGYCLFSAAMIFGGIWAYFAWGTYWLWTPKELWTTILWLFYSLYLHARLRKQWAGRPSVILSITGFIIVMFTYLGVSLFMKSSHTF